MIGLCNGDYQLDVLPEHGGAVGRFEWRSLPVFRTAVGTEPFDTSSFPLVPFSNRIRNGKFCGNGQEVSLSRNMAAIAHPLHGFGWLAAWRVADVQPNSARIIHREDGNGEWPWAYEAEQHFVLGDNGLTMQLSLRNMSDASMPAGLGFHPYFPCDVQTRYLGLHKGEWQNDLECLPVTLKQSPEPQDWWQGAPVATRNVDTVYTRREGPLEIFWPAQKCILRMMPSANLPFTLVYTPEGEDYFCVEPVSHMTDAVNWAGPDTGLIALAPGASVEVSCHLEMFEDA